MERHGLAVGRSGSGAPVSLTAADWLALVEGRLGPPLVPADTVASISPICRRLPGSCQLALEIHLADPPPRRRVDLAVRVRTVEEAEALRDQVAAPRASAALERWTSDPEMRIRAPELWLELDLLPDPASRPPGDAGDPGHGVLEALARPVLCARLEPGVEPRWIVDTLLPALSGQGSGGHGGDPHGDGAGEELLEARQRRGLLAALDHLPPPARPLYAFDLSARRQPRAEEGSSAAEVRLELFGVPADSLEPYLRSLGDEASGERAARLTPLVEEGARTHLSLDFTPGGHGPGERVGLEISFRRLPDREPGWERLFHALEERGLCRPGERRAALDWPGHDSFWSAGGRWPAAAGAVYCVRSLSHVKVLTWPGGGSEAKLYLLLGPVAPAGRRREG